MQYQLLDILIEFKYVSLAEAGLSKAQVKALPGKELPTLAPVQQKLAQSKAKLKGYQETLEAAYGDKLRLRVYSVVAVGFDRLLWREMHY